MFGPRRGNWLRASLVQLAALLVLTACAGGPTSAAIPGSTATKGPITVTTNLTTYSVNDAIGVTVSNTSSTDYFTESGKSACVIIQLERYNPASSKWTATDQCVEKSAAQTLAIAQGTKEQFTLAPTSSADPNAWLTGLYRVSVIYSAKDDGVTDPQLANCAAFRIS